MKYEVIQKRNEFYYKVWEQLRGYYSMEKMAFFMKVPLKSLYRIIAEQNKYPTKKKPTLKQIKKVEDLINNA